MGGKSERMRKLEEELSNLEQWMKLGLVPKKDSTKFQEEIETIKSKRIDEQEKMQLLKESGQIQEFVASKRVNAKVAGYAENPTVAEIDSMEDRSNFSDSSYHMTNSESNMSNDSFDKDNSGGFGNSATYDEMGDDYTRSSKNRTKNWHGFIDPDADNW